MNYKLQIKKLENHKVNQQLMAKWSNYHKRCKLHLMLINKNRIKQVKDSKANLMTIKIQL